MELISIFQVMSQYEIPLISNAFILYQYDFQIVPILNCVKEKKNYILLHFLIHFGKNSIK